MAPACTYWPPPRGALDSFDALRQWADTYVHNEDVLEGGCSFGSLVSEIMKTDLDVRDAIIEGFDRWRKVFRSGLQAMKDHGDLRRNADLDHLTHVLMAAFQGGMLLTQADRDHAALRDALYGAIAYVESHAARRPAPSTDTPTELCGPVAGDGPQGPVLWAHLPFHL